MFTLRDVCVAVKRSLLLKGLYKFKGIREQESKTNIWIQEG